MKLPFKKPSINQIAGMTSIITILAFATLVYLIITSNDVLIKIGIIIGGLLALFIIYGLFYAIRQFVRNCIEDWIYVKETNKRHREYAKRHEQMNKEHSTEIT